MVMKTVKLGIHKEVHAIKRQAMTDTQELYNRVIRFYMEFFVAHLGIFEEKVPTTKKNGDPAERNWTAQELLTFAERHTLSTGAHPEPLMPLIGAIPQAEGMPTGLRRAAINHASGKVKGCTSCANNGNTVGKKAGPRNWVNRTSRSLSTPTWWIIPTLTCCRKPRSSIPL